MKGHNYVILFALTGALLIHMFYLVKSQGFIQYSYEYWFFLGKYLSY